MRTREFASEIYEPLANPLEWMNGRFSRKFTLKSWFLRKIWLYQLQIEKNKERLHSTVINVLTPPRPSEITIKIGGQR
jgi:hypothetical protein